MESKNCRAFTLIELLVTISIIGILAGVVTFSLTDEQQHAEDQGMILSIESAKPALTRLALSNRALTGNALCTQAFDRISISSTYLHTWTATADCGGDGADEEHEICCASEGREWVVWGRLSTYDDTATAAADAQKDIYCMDDDGFSGEVDLTSAVTAGGSGSFKTTGTDFACE